jgi:hypothetical protein
MTKVITLVLDAHPAAIEHFKTQWHPEQLARDLTAGGTLEAAVFVGKLEDAPDSWAYILYTNNEDISNRATVAAFKDRLAKAILIEENMMDAPKVAEQLGALGAMDFVASSWSKGENFIVVKSAIGQQLGWPLSPIQKSANYARTAKTGLTLPKLLVKYLEAARGSAS